ncbi:MAG: hypothetical protein IPH62_09075 [Ignavibacteriae bacterium]|nr:hypothetical protein [Ignavibacteriota bacterium]
MKPIVCVSSEGNDTKIVVLSKEKDKIKVKKTFSMIMSGGHDFKDPMGNNSEIQFLKNSDSDISFDSINESGGKLATVDKNDVSFVANYFGSDELKNADFISVVTDPIVNHHIFTGNISNNKQKTLNAIIGDIAKQKNITVAPDSIDYIKIDEKTLHSVFLREDNPSVNFINAWAAHNGRRYYKISTIKNSETALANYVIKINKFFDEDFTLIINTGHESSKLIFLKGSKLLHIGSSLDIGTQNIHTYDVYFSKILLEMENGGIPRLDNVILCGEDKSENLVLSFYGTFPEANVTELKFDNMDTSSLNEEQIENLAAFAFPLAAGIEFFESKGNKHVGINFLPKYIVENQKAIQFGWHALLVFPLLFAATFFFTFQILENNKKIAEQRMEIERLKLLKAQNELIIAEMDQLTTKISKFDETQAILDSATAGTEIWGNMLTNVSDFMERRRNFWIAGLETNVDQTVAVKGYTLNRNVLTEFADANNSSLLNTVTFEPLRETKSYSYSLKFNIKSNGAEKNEP